MEERGMYGHHITTYKTTILQLWRIGSAEEGTQGGTDQKHDEMKKGEKQLKKGEK